MKDFDDLEVKPEVAKQIDDVCGYGAQVKVAQCLVAAELKAKKNKPGLSYYRSRIGAPMPRAKASNLFPWYFNPEKAQCQNATENDIDALILLAQLNKEKAYDLYKKYEDYPGISIHLIYDEVQQAKKRAPRGETLAKQVVNVMRGWKETSEDDRAGVVVEEYTDRLLEIPSIKKEWDKRGEPVH